jgi:hypothetical protein
MVIGKTLARSVGLRQRNGTLGEKRPVAIQHVPETNSGVKPEAVKLRRKPIKTSKLGFFAWQGTCKSTITYHDIVFHRSIDMARRDGFAF